MGFDKTVHSKPGFYAWKLSMIAFAKQAAYRVLFLDKHVGAQREELQRKNVEILSSRLPGKKVLEVGCGRGSFLRSLHDKYGCECTGVDISAQMIGYAQEHYPGPRYMVVNGSKLPFADDEFDFVIFCYVLHHVDDLPKMIEEAKRVGRNILIYESCAFESQPWRWLSQMYWKAVDGGMWYHSAGKWRSIFGIPVAEQILGHGLVRYGQILFRRP